MYLLIDGSNIVHRVLHSTYRDTGTYSYLEAIPQLIKIFYRYSELLYSHVGFIVAWDKGLPLFRRELYPEYKPDSTPIGDISPSYLSKINLDPEKSYRTHHSNKDFQEEYTKAVDILSKTILPACNCLSIRVDNCEADDIIAWFCYNFPNLNKRIISSDRDLFQLINDTTSVYSFVTNTEYDMGWVIDNYPNFEKFREHYLLDKAIVGDISDNIPKIEGISDKTVKKYSSQLIECGKPISEGLKIIEKPFRASQRGYNNIKNGYTLIDRNLKIIDLYYPIKENLDFVSKIRSQFIMMRNFKPEYFSSIEVLENIEGLSSRCINLAGKIFQSNATKDRLGDFLNEIK